MMANGWKDYFTFTKKERAGIIVLMGLIIVIYSVPVLLPDDRSVKIHYRADSVQHASTSKNSHGQQYDGAHRIAGSRYEDDQTTTKLTVSAKFEFDPNTLDEEGWQRLGVHERTIRTIMNFRSKGGQFRQPSDLRKVYGMNKVICEALIPYVRIQKSFTEIARRNVEDVTKTRIYRDYSSRNNYRERTEIRNDSTFYNTRFGKHTGTKTIDINVADSAAWEQLPGIGSKLASRIILFRERLGGFYSISQVAETFGISDSTFKIILPYLSNIEFPLRKININEAAAAELARHPYIRWTLATTIVNYRNQHGRFKDAGELKFVTAITPDLLEKLNPYLVVQ